jgi:TonB family protein
VKLKALAICVLFISTVTLSAQNPGPDAGGSAATPPALTRVQVRALVKGGIPGTRVVILLNERGINFNPSDDDVQEVRAAGASPEVLSALASAKRITPPGNVSASHVENQASAPAGDNKPVKRIRVGGAVERAMLIYKPSPVYPPLAKTARIQGVVRLEAVIGKDGTLQDLKVITGHPLLLESALMAVSQWVYKPTLLNGEPVEVVTEIDVNYALDFQ